MAVTVPFLATIAKSDAAAESTGSRVGVFTAVGSSPTSSGSSVPAVGHDKEPEPDGRRSGDASSDRSGSRLDGSLGWSLSSFSEWLGSGTRPLS
jgi:hypothetical protein